MINQYLENRISLPVLALIIVWTLFWKGYAVWTAAKNNHKGWFIVLLFINTLGILEIIYLFFIMKKTWLDVKRVFLQVVVPKKNSKK